MTASQDTGEIDAVDETDDMYVLVECDGTAGTPYVEVYVADSSGGLATRYAADNWCFRSTDFTITPGFIGFARGYGYIDDLTIRSDTDDDGEFDDVGGSEIEFWDDFTLDAGNTHVEQQLVHDAAGNLTYDGECDYTYDAWNRLAEVARAYRDSDENGVHETASIIAAICYDGMGRRISKAVDNFDDWDQTYHYYYSGQQMVEMRDGSGQTIKQYVWGRMYIDELVQVGINIVPASNDNCDHFFYALQDANFNVMGIVNHAGRLLERYEYSPYGQRTVYSHGWLASDIDGDGAVDNTDLTAYATNYGKSGSEISPPEADIDGSGTVDDTDGTCVAVEWQQSLPADDPLVLQPHMESFRFVPFGGIRAYGLCDIGHQGLLHDKEFALIYNRARYLHPRPGLHSDLA